MSRKQRPRDAAKRPKAERHKRQKHFSRFSKRKRVPRDAAEAREWLKQFASEARDIQEEMLKAFRPMAETARNAIPLWIEPSSLSLRPCELVCRRGGRLHPRKADEEKTSRAFDGRCAGFETAAGAAKRHAEGVACEPQFIFITFCFGAKLGMGSPIAIRWTFARFSGFMRRTRMELLSIFLATSSFRSATTSRTAS